MNKSIKRILISLAITGLIVPGVLHSSNVRATNTQSKVEQSNKQTNSSSNIIQSDIPDINSTYWHNWRHVNLTEPLNVRLVKWIKQNGIWHTKTLQQYQIPKGRSVYILGGPNNRFTISNQPPKKLNSNDSVNDVNKSKNYIYTRFTNVPTVNLVNDQEYNVSAKRLNYAKANYDSVVGQTFYKAYRKPDDNSRALLFSNFNDFKRYSDLSSTMGDIGDSDLGEEGDSQGDKNYVKKVKNQYYGIQNKALHYGDVKHPLLVQLTNMDYYRVKYNNKIYYTDIMGHYVPYNTDEDEGEIDSNLSPDAADKQYIRTPQNKTIYAYSGMIWRTFDLKSQKYVNWQYDGSQWIFKK